MRSNNYIHGLSHSYTYNCWSRMKNRCDNPNSTGYSRYGGRGIKYSEKWKNFNGFLEDMGIKPQGLTLERKDNNLGYSRGNCKWATIHEQASNRRNNNKTVGVSVIEKTGKYRAYGNIEGKRTYFGVFTNEWDAICARKSWEYISLI